MSNDDRAEDVVKLQSELEKADAKMATFMETTQTSCKKMLKDGFAKVNKRIDKVFDSFVELRNNVNERIDKFINDHNRVDENIILIKKMIAEIESQKKEIHEVIEGYKAFQTAQAGNAEVEVERNQKKKLSALRQDIEAQRSELSNLVKDFEKLGVENNQFKSQVSEHCRGFASVNEEEILKEIGELRDDIEKLIENKCKDNKEK